MTEADRALVERLRAMAHAISKEHAFPFNQPERSQVADQAAARLEALSAENDALRKERDEAQHQRDYAFTFEREKEAMALWDTERARAEALAGQVAALRSEIDRIWQWMLDSATSYNQTGKPLAFDATKMHVTLADTAAAAREYRERIRRETLEEAAKEVAGFDASSLADAPREK